MTQKDTTKTTSHSLRSNRRTFVYLSGLSAATVVGTGTVSAQNDSDEDGGEETGDEDSTEEDGGEETGDEDSTEEDGGEETGDEDSTEEDGTICEGSPTMSRTSVTTPNSRITTDDPAVVEANFRPDPTMPDDCTVVVDLEFSFSDAGFQWGGGADWDQATSNLVVGTFEVRPGEVRDIRAELHTQGAEAGDDVTVVADYELWFEGNRENSVQQSGIRHTINVEAPNPAPQEVETEDGENDTVFSIPGFGIPSALAGLGGAGYLLKSRLPEDSK